MFAKIFKFSILYSKAVCTQIALDKERTKIGDNMAQKKKLSFGEKLMLGREKSEDYARSTLPSNRWELFWDIFKGRFWKLVIINFLMLIFLIPIVLMIIFRSSAMSGYGAVIPYSQPFGVGYQAPLSYVGHAEQIVFNVNSSIFLFLPIAAIIAAIGISGGAYVIRNMVWTEGIFVANDFWRGIKKNFMNVLFTLIMFSLVFYVGILTISFCDNLLVNGGARWLCIILKVISYIVMILFGIMSMHMLTMSVTYEMKFRHMIKNSFLFTISFFPHTIFFLALAMIPFILLMIGGVLMVIGLVLLALFGVSYMMLVWTTFSQWIYDNYVNDKIEGAQRNRGIYEKVKEGDSGALKKYKEQLNALPKCALNSRPIKPITDDELVVAELPTSFNRNDILKLNESKQAIYDDHAKYVEEHKNDPQYEVKDEFKKMEADAKARQKRIDMAKKELAKRNRNK